MADAPQTVIENIDNVVRLEEGLRASRGLAGRTADHVVNVAGRLSFVFLQFALAALWIVVNAGLVPGIQPFDPFPYSFASEILSLEGVLLACFVLMKQRHESRLSERRSHLALQANLLVEKEVTKLIQMIQQLGTAMGHEHVKDAQSAEMASDTAVEQLSEELDRRMDAKSG